VIVASSFGGGEVWMIVAILVLLGVLSFLALAETGLTQMSRVKAQALADDGNPQGPRLVRLVERPERFLNPVLLAINICQTVQATLTGILADRLFGPVGVIVAVILNIVVFFVLAEALPKTWAILYPERAALVAARPVSALVRFPPLALLSRMFIGITNILVKGKGLQQGPFVSERELLGIVEAAAERDVIEHEERELIESIIELGDTVAREIMVPRTDMVTVSSTSTASSAIEVFIERGFSRVPVVAESVDDVVGIAYAKDLLRAEREGRGDSPVAELARPAIFVPDTKPVAPLMREMQSAKFHMAILVDEYGGTAGLVTLEDCIEELIGEIVDEYDVEDRDEVERLPSGEWRLDAGLPVGDVNELLGVELPDDEWDTVGGFVIARLGHLPSAGEEITYAGHRFVAETVEGRRIATVRVVAVPADGETPAQVST
jgi:CBS domain containing-hemolysin-like protein